MQNLNELEYFAIAFAIAKANARNNKNDMEKNLMYWMISYILFYSLSFYCKVPNREKSNLI